MTTNVVWFRNDLRVADHSPLVAAARRGPVVCLYIYEPDIMAAEDFSYMLQQRDGAYIWLGAGKDSVNLHSPLYDFNDELLPIGASLWVRMVEAKLAQQAV